MRIDPGGGEKPACLTLLRALWFGHDTFQSFSQEGFSSLSCSSVKKVARGNAGSLCEKREEDKRAETACDIKIRPVRCVKWNKLSKVAQIR